MKNFRSLVCLVFATFLLVSCSERGKDNAVIKQLDGRWEITRFVYKELAKPDSLVIDQQELDLGALVFDKCESKNSNADRCDGRRTLDDGRQFGYEYAADGNGGRTGRTVTLAFLSPIDSKDDLTGVYDIVELTDFLILRRGGDDFEIHARR